MILRKYLYIFAVFTTVLTFSSYAYADGGCDKKFIVESKGTMMGGMGEVNTTMYRKSCDEFAQKQVTKMAGFNQEQHMVQKDGFVYTNNGGQWTKTREPDFVNLKKLREEGKSEKEIVIALGGKPLNKESNEFLEPCSFWEFFGSTVCYTSDMIPVNIKNQAMEMNAVKITRGEYGPESNFKVPADLPETDFDQPGEMPDMNKLMKELMKEQ